MQIQFAHPTFLLLLIPLTAHVAWMARRLELLATPRRWTAVAVRVAVLGLLIVALAGLRVARESKELTVFYVYDQSRSLPEPQRELAARFVEASVGRMGPDDRAGVVAFGAEAALDEMPERNVTHDGIQAVVDERRTNIAQALDLALACFPGEGQKRIVLLSDGNQNAGNASEAARAAAASGVAIDVLPLQYRNRNDAIVEKVIVDNRVNLNEPFNVRVVATAREDTPARLNVMQDGRMLGQLNVELEAGRKNVFPVPAELTAAGFHQYEVLLEVEGDLIPENNRGFAFAYGEGEPAVLLVDGDEPPSDALPAMLQSEQIEVRRIDPDRFPRSLGALLDFDGIVFNNVGADRISREQMEMIERAVHTLGIGFMMIGGENSFGAGGYNDSPIEVALPVNMELKNEKIIPQGAIVPIVHTVEIPEGQYWGEQVILAALNTLHPRDMMGVMYYSWQGGESWLFPLQEVGTKDHLRAQIRNLQGGDMPSFDRTMQMAYEGLVACPASVKHMIIVSDGDPQTPNPALLRKIKSAGISISTVCINPHSPRDTRVMRDVAALGGGNFYAVQSYNNLPQIFVKEAATVRKSLIIEEPFEPMVAAYSPLLTGFGEAYPTLLGYVGTSGKGLADVPLKTHKGDPLLAHWRHGVGKAVAFTSDAKELWARDWTRWEGYGKFWSQAVRWMLRSRFSRNFQVEMQIDGSRGKVTINAIGDEGEFRNFLDIGGRLITPSLEEREVEFRQTAPGRYEAQFEADEAGTYMLGAAAGEATAELDARELITGGAVLSYSPEFQQSRSNDALLYRLADMTGGRVLGVDDPVFVRDRRSYADPRPLWPLLLTIALGLFLFDVFVRRVLIGWDELSRGFELTVEWLRVKLLRRPAMAGPTDQLLQVKQDSREETSEAERAAFLERLREVKVEESPSREAGDATPGPAAKSASEKAESEAPRATEEQPSFTGELLKARKRAQRGKNKGDEQ